MHSRGSGIFTKLPRGRIPDFSLIRVTDWRSFVSYLKLLIVWNASKLIGWAYSIVTWVKSVMIQFPNRSSFSW